MTNSDEQQIQELMGKVFPGYEEYTIDSVTPSITGGEEPVISFMIVCNEEAALDFSQTDEIAAEVHVSWNDHKSLNGKDLHLRFEFIFPLFQLEFFAVVEAQNEQQSSFYQTMNQVDYFIIWVVDQGRNLLKVLQINGIKK